MTKRSPGKEEQLRKEKTDRNRELLRTHLQAHLQDLTDPQQGTSRDTGREYSSRNRADMNQQKKVDEKVEEQILQEGEDIIMEDGEVQKLETTEEEEVEVVQKARVLTPLPSGEHPRKEYISDTHPDIPEGHPEPLYLFAVRSRRNGYWIWMPKTKGFCGPIPRNGIAARVEKVSHDGREFKIIGYGTKVGNIQVWYDYNEVMRFFPRFFEPEEEVQSFSNEENFPERELKRENSGGDNRKGRDQGKKQSSHKKEEKSKKF